MPGFRDYDGKARLALAGGVVAVLSLFLPWLSVRLGLQRADISGWGLVVLPATVRGLSAQTAGPEVWLVALLGGLAVVACVAACLLALAPGLRSGAAWHARSGLYLSIAGLALSLVAIGVFGALVGPKLGTVYFEPGAAFVIVGLLLAAAGWSGSGAGATPGPDVSPHSPR
ncbi:MAG: hypothetical protein LC624_01430 [Halobacteriales archaeon]|nr:hypothetical protein [Halobacteriales archaeon]